MKQTLLITVAMLLVTGMAQARLGETDTQCAARYGQEIQRFVCCAHYKTGDLITKVTFDAKGKAVQLRMSLVSYKALDAETIAAVKAANGDRGAVVTVNKDKTEITVSPYNPAPATAAAVRPKF